MIRRDRGPAYYVGWIIGISVAAIAVLLPVAAFLALLRFIGWIVAL